MSSETRGRRDGASLVKKKKKTAMLGGIKEGGGEGDTEEASGAGERSKKQLRQELAWHRATLVTVLCAQDGKRAVRFLVQDEERSRYERRKG